MIEALTVNKSSGGKCECPDAISAESFDEVNKGDTLKSTKRDSYRRGRGHPGKGGSEDSKRESSQGGGRRLKSSKCAKPDETDILKAVRFPHERLDSRHTQLKTFDKLPFNLLIAGELETIASNIPEEERWARIDIAKTMCYHKLYLDDEDLRNGYDDIMKQVERGDMDWTSTLVDKMHEHYVFRANVNLRNKLDSEGFTKVERRNNSKTERPATELDRVVYCQEFNKKSCVHPDHHEGRFMNRKVTKWHVCSKCLKTGDKKSHPLMDCNRGSS